MPRGGSLHERPLGPRHRIRLRRGPDPVGRFARPRRRKAHHAARLERRGKDDAAPGSRGRAPGMERQRAARRPRRDQALPTREGAAWPCPRARRPPALRDDDDRREPRNGRDREARARVDPRGYGSRLRALPAPRRAAKPARGHALRRRAADARDRARTHGSTADPHVRRAEPRTLAPLHDQPVRDHPGPQGRSDHHAARRAERAARTRRERRGVRARAWQGDASRDGTAGARDARGAQGVSRPLARMKLDAFLTSLPIERAGEYAGGLERGGFHGLWLAELQTDPLLPLAAASVGTKTLRLGTGIAIAFARSPMVTAMDAWALQRASGGRLDLGLGTQVRAHVERRFAMPYDRPAARMREYVLALRHIWGAFQHEHPLRFRGEFYRLDLLSPFFDPGPIAYPRIAIYLAAVNAGMYRVAGEVADGIVGHPFSTASYLRDVALPALRKGLAKAKRDRAELTFAGPVFTVVDSSPTRAADEAYARQQIAFYASTPSYRAVLSHHGWDAVGEELSALARAGRFDDLASRVTDEMLEAFATRAPTYAGLGVLLRERYGGILDRIGLYGEVARVAPRDIA